MKASRQPGVRFPQREISFLSFFFFFWPCCFPSIFSSLYVVHAFPLLCAFPFSFSPFLLSSFHCPYLRVTHPRRSHSTTWTAEYHTARHGRTQQPRNLIHYRLNPLFIPSLRTEFCQCIDTLFSTCSFRRNMTFGIPEFNLCRFEESPERVPREYDMLNPFLFDTHVKGELTMSD